MISVIAGKGQNECRGVVTGLPVSGHMRQRPEGGEWSFASEQVCVEEKNVPSGESNESKL